MIHHANPHAFVRTQMRMARASRWRCAGPFILVGAVFAYGGAFALRWTPPQLLHVLLLLAGIQIGLLATHRFLRVTLGTLLRLRVGASAERRALRSLRHLPDDVHVFTNYKPRSWPYDLDAVVVTPTSIAVVEIKSDPGRVVEGRDGSLESHQQARVIPLDRWVRKTRTRSHRLKQLLIHWAATHRLPSGIPTPHAVVAFHACKGVRIGGRRDAVSVGDLGDAVQRLPANLPPLLYRPLVAALEAGQ